MSKVFVGLSGGVDSAVSAALLKEQGHDITGAFIKIWQPEFLECTWREDRLDAMRVCAALGIPFREIDLSDEYKKEVVDSMIATYQRGETPNPDVLCNESIKFGSFMQWALAEGAEYVATGHYAQTKDGKLFRGADAAKDQSYFLHRLTGAELSQIIFPVGGMKKSDVRALAERFDLPVAAKHDSQGLCFVGDVSMRDFLARFITVTTGPVLDMRGNSIGEHEGAMLYTIGQRHGFTISAAGDSRAPHTVVAIDVATNSITVSHNKEDAMVYRVLLENMHWVGETPALPLRTAAQVRYRESPIGVQISRQNNAFIAQFDELQIATSGQSLVFYDGNACLGGGIMRRFVHNDAKERVLQVQ